jgi:hypothetical protein
LDLTLSYKQPASVGKAPELIAGRAGEGLNKFTSLKDNRFKGFGG